MPHKILYRIIYCIRTLNRPLNHPLAGPIAAPYRPIFFPIGPILVTPMWSSSLAKEVIGKVQKKQIVDDEDAYDVAIKTILVVAKNNNK